jgi:hypothetical protein
LEQRDDSEVPGGLPAAGGQTIRQACRKVNKKEV